VDMKSYNVLRDGKYQDGYMTYSLERAISMLKTKYGGDVNYQIEDKGTHVNINLV